MKTPKNLFAIMVLTLTTAVLLTGCVGSKYMRETNTLQQPGEGYALVTFVRPVSFGFGVECMVWDGEQFAGMLNAHKVLEYQASPGEHLFLAHTGNWSYLKATLEAGKHYYVVAKIFPGKAVGFKVGVALNPVVKGGEVTDEQINEWVSNGTPSEMIPEECAALQAKQLPRVREAIDNFHAGEVEYAVLAVDDSR